MVATGASLPVAVCGQDARQVVAGKSEPGDDAVDRGRWAGGQVIRYPAEPRQRAELEGGAESVLDSHVRGEPTDVVAGQREVRDQIGVGDLVRPATEPRELGAGQELKRQKARYR